MNIFKNDNIFEFENVIRMYFFGKNLVLFIIFLVVFLIIKILVLEFVRLMMNVKDDFIIFFFEWILNIFWKIFVLISLRSFLVKLKKLIIEIYLSV